MATPLRLWGFLILMTLAMQGACFSGGEYRIFAPGFVANGREPLRHFCTNSSLRAACEHLEKGKRQEAQQILRDYLKVHSSDLIAVTAYTQSLTEKELQQLLSQLEGRQQTLSAAERYQLGIAALYLWDRSAPIVPGDPRLPTIDRWSRLAAEHLRAAYRLRPEPIVAFHLWEMHLMQPAPSRAVEVMEDQLRRIGGQAIYERYLQAKRRKWTGVAGLPVPSLPPERLWLFSRVVNRLYSTFGIEWGTQVPVYREGTAVMIGIRQERGIIDRAGRDYMKEWYDRIQKALPSVQR